MKSGILEDLRYWTPECGVPQGAVISPLLSNIYLNGLDHMMAQAEYEMTRYADDFVIQCRTQAEADRALSMVAKWTTEHDLSLHPTKTKIVDGVSEGFEFLGYRFVNHTRHPRKKSLMKLCDSIRAKTKRSNGYSLQYIISDINLTSKGWLSYFKHSHWWTFERLDGWIRMRLRSILRKRLGLRGRGRGLDHHRWPNTYFAKHGLFSLKRAYVLAVQSSTEVKPSTGEPYAGEPHVRFGGGDG